jgi:hypothetical protein
VQEIEDPELATKRTRAFYKAKGYSDVWIEKCLRGIAIREELTDEWDKRDVKEEKDYAILTAEISKATFDLTPNEYKKVKGLKRLNPRKINLPAGAKTISRFPISQCRIPESAVLLPRR